MSGALDYWNLLQARSLGARLKNCRDLAAARRLLAELNQLFPPVAPGAFVRKDDEAMPPALPCRLRVEEPRGSAGRGVGPMPAAGGDPDVAGNAAGQPVPVAAAPKPRPTPPPPAPEPPKVPPGPSSVVSEKTYQNLFGNKPRVKFA